MKYPKTTIALTEIPLDLEICRQLVASKTVGGECHFVGTVRDSKNGIAVSHLDFEAYEPMAIFEMTKIAEAAKQQFAISDVLIHHRIGRVHIGEIAVVIIAVAPHRDAAFDACRFAIDTLKQTVPIWKKEVTTDGEEWISAHP